MHSQDRGKSRRTGIAGPGALLLVLATLIVLAGERISVLETAYYDFIQRRQEAPVNDGIVLIDTHVENGAEGLWEPTYFSALVERLNEAGARLIVPVHAPPSNPLLPEMSQLDALAELEAQARRMGQRGGDTASAAPLADQLAKFRAQYAAQEAIARTVRESKNIVLPISTHEGSSPASNKTTDCQAHAVNIPAEDADLSVAAVRYGLSMPKIYCDSALTAGYAGLLPDADGVLRRLHLLVRSGSSIFPALPLAVLSATSGGKSVHIDEKAHVVSGDKNIATGRQFEQLLRFYGSGTQGSAFPVARGADLLSDDALAEQVKDRIVLIGDLAPERAGGLRTPKGESVAPAVLVATALSNLLNGDALWRPAWLPSAELVVLVLLGIGIVILVPRMGKNRALLGAAGLAIVLLGAEAYALLAHGVWIQTIGVAMFTVLGAAVVYVFGARQQAHAATGVTLGGAAALMQDDDELDLRFSVLRQQPPTEETKASLYRVAMSHGKRREFAKAERVFMYIASLDPEYRDVAEKLAKLSGARKKTEAAAGDASAPAAPKKPAVSAGRKLGRYELVETLGRGAMATVYVGRDPNINRKVAIKTIALAEEFSEADLEAAKLQFRREAESAGRLNHPNIIAIYDTGEDDNVAYLAMEYCGGKPLSEFAQPDNLLPPKWVLELTARAAEALHYAHGQNVVHRDIKPANILYDAATDTLKITDFGIARLTDTSRTKTGIILGTPSYMSPEQLSASAVTGKSDFYSLGITMYQLLTGTTPFRSDSIPKLMDKIVNEKHTPISSIRDDIPMCVDEVLDRVLAKNPDDRYPNGRAMALALRDCCSSFDGQG